MNDPDQTVTWNSKLTVDLRDRLAAYEEPGDSFYDQGAAPSGRGLVSLGYIFSALGRGGRLLICLAIAGVVIGGGYYVSSSGEYKATTSVLLVDDPTANPVTVSATDIALAESLPVATGVVQQLGLQETPSSFASSYSVTAVTTQVLQVSATAPSSAAAVQRAAAIASQFLKFRAHYEQQQQQQTNTALAGQVAQAQQSLNSISQQITQATAAGDSSQLPALKAQQTQATNNLESVQQYAATTKADSETVTTKMVRGSRVLNEALPVKASKAKAVLIDVLGGLIGGLALGVAIIVIGAVVSDRLRRRDDIAYAFGAPVGLSVGPLQRGRIPAFRGRAVGRRRDMDRIVEYLRKTIPGKSGRVSGLAVVAVDDAPTTAQAVVACTELIAKRARVVLADLSAGAQAARLLGVRDPGVRSVDLAGSRVVVVVPTETDTAIIGPLRAPGGSTHGQPDEAVTAACAQADLVLSLVSLDPAVGGDHVATWATAAVAMITAGRSTATKIHAAGEMLKLGGTRLDSVIVLDTDRSDESLGAVAR